MHFTLGATNEERNGAASTVAYPPLWLPVLVLTAAASPSPPPSSMPPSPSSPPAYVFKSLYWLKRAAQEFDVDPAATIARYGPIADWDVSAISNMAGVFYNSTNFNADISSWDTSSVTDMTGMFAAARAFNQPLSFDTSRVTAMMAMFQVSLFHTLLAYWPITLQPTAAMPSFRLGRAHPRSTSRWTLTPQASRP